MNYGKQLKRIRRFLRDPDGNIWSDALIKNLFNDAQREVQMKTGFLEEIAIIRVPPRYHWSYTYDWEWEYIDGTQHYQAFKQYHQGDYSVTYNWETQFNNSGDAKDEGAHFTHPWEAFMTTPGDQVKIKFPTNFHSVKFFFYDREPMDYVTKKQIQSVDSSYINYTGRTYSYYIDDELDNSFVPYPVPNDIAWDDTENSSADYIYTYDWERDGEYITGQGEKLTKTDADNNREYVFSWELDFTGTDEAYHGMWLFEAEYIPSDHVALISGDTEDQHFGIIGYREGSLDADSLGLVFDIIEADNNFLLNYNVIPEDMVFDADESEFPQFLRKYIEHHVLSRAYRVNNDGRIKSLADYWDYRVKIDMQLMNRFIRKRKNDRDYRLSTPGIPDRKYRQLPRLPTSYPRI